VKSADFISFGGGYRGNNGHQFLKGKITLEKLRQWAEDDNISVILDADSKISPVEVTEKQAVTALGVGS
jgi:hypothetical protein